METVKNSRKKRIITIGGRPGSGKSTTSKKVAELLGLTHFSSGDFLREIAKARDMTIEKINTLAETDRSIDEAVDAELQRRGREDDDLIIDSRLAFHWIPDSFKVYLELPLDEAARRIFEDKNEGRRSTSEEAGSVDEVRKQIKERIQSEEKRYRELYDINPYDPNHYDLVIDTESNSIEEVTEKIVKSFNEWIAK